jgi:glycosyltransferase involved in cell wall biosynthesis
MTILHIITSTDIGGAEMSLFRLVNEFKKKGIFKQYVISIKKNGIIADRIIKLGIPVYSIRNDLLLIIKLLFILKKDKKNSIIQSWLYHADLLASIIALFFRIKVIWNIRQTKFTKSDSKLTWLVMKLCSYLSYIVPTYIVCVAKSASEEHIKKGYCGRKINIIQNGFIIDDFQINEPQKNDLKSKLNIDFSTTIVGFVGRFHPIKDYLTFINTAKDLITNSSKSFTFLMIGKDFDENNKLLISILKSNNLTNYFKLIGNQNDVIPYYSIMDVFCLTSLSEGFPNVLVEAILMEVPVFSTRCGDAEFIIKNNKFLFDFENHKMLSKKIIDYIDKANEIKKIETLENKKHIINNFSMDVIFDKYLVLYKKSLKCVD